MIAAEIIVDCLSAYAAAGTLFAIAFVARGIGLVDPVAKGSKIGFRLMVFPGVVALWPVLFQSWIRKGRQSHD